MPTVTAKRNQSMAGAAGLEPAYNGIEIRDLIQLGDAPEPRDGALPTRSVSRSTMLQSRREMMCSLRDSGMTYQAIASQFGVTRERVRQILFLTGRGGVRPHRPAESQSNFYWDALAEGVSVQGIPGASGSALRKMFLAPNGTVYVIAAFWRPKSIPFCVSIKRPSTQADFYAYEVPDGSWLIIPYLEAPVSDTMFSLLGVAFGQPGHHYSKRHDYPAYINAWHLLGGKMQIGDPVSAASVPLRRRSLEKYVVLIEKLKSLPDGMALPVECEDVKDAQGAQSAVFCYQNTGKLNGRKYKVERRKSTIYITAVIGGSL